MASQNSNYVYRTINTLTGLTTEPVTKPTTAISLTSDDWDLINDLKVRVFFYFFFLLPLLQRLHGRLLRGGCLVQLNTCGI